MGMTLVSMPRAESRGSATVREHLPRQDISCIAATLRCLLKVLLSIVVSCLFGLVKIIQQKNKEDNGTKGNGLIPVGDKPVCTFGTIVSFDAFNEKKKVFE